MLTHRVTLLFFCISFIAVVPYWTLAQVAPSEQLTNQDVSKIVALLGGSGDSGSTGLGDSVASESKEKQSTDVNSLPVPKAIPISSDTPTQEDITQSLSMLNTLVSSGGISPETLKLFGLNLPSTPTTTTTTENPNGAEAQQAIALLNALLGAAGGESTGASSSDAASLAALLSLAAAASTPQQQGGQSQQQSTADAALLTNLLLSSAAAGSPAADPSKVKQQDFGNFQNAGLNLDSASSNQLSGILGLLGTLGSLGSPQPSIFNLGQQQQAQSNLLSGLLGGGQAQSNLLSGLLASASGQQAQKPGLLSSLGTLASVVGTSLSQGDGKPRVRGVDTRLGLGYRFGENADAQVVWEIGPQLFTEPLSNEQKQQILLQQQQLQRRQLQNANRRVHVVHRPPTRQPVKSSMSRRHLSVVPTNGPFVEPSQNPYILFQNGPSTHGRVAQPPSPKNLYKVENHPPANFMRDLENENENNAHHYAKKEGNRVNKDSQLTEYERWLLSNPNRDQIHQQQLLVNTNNQLNRKDAFIFSKDNANNIVRVRIQPRESPRHVQIYQTVSGMTDVHGNGNGGNRIPLMPINKLSHRMGGYDGYNPAADDSYARRNAVVHNPSLRDMERQKERQQHFQHSNRRVSHGAGGPTLSEWSDKNSFFDVMQNYVLTSLQSEGNNLVKNFFQAREQQEKQQAQVQPPPSNLSRATPSQQQQRQQKPSSSSGLIPSLKGLLGMGVDKPGKKPGLLKSILKPTVKPVIRVGDDVSYDDLKLMLNGGQDESASHVVPIIHQASQVIEKGATPSPEIFIDIENGEVSMRKSFGSMESFTPPPPPIIPDDSPKHVFKVLQEQLKEQYEKVKYEQLREAAKQRRKENIAQGLSNPNDPLYMASKYFELLEKEERK